MPAERRSAWPQQPGAEIRCNTGVHVCVLPMEGRPLHGMTFGVVGTITPLVDLWVDIRGLPDHMRLALKPGE